MRGRDGAGAGEDVDVDKVVGDDTAAPSVVIAATPLASRLAGSDWVSGVVSIVDCTVGAGAGGDVDVGKDVGDDTAPDVVVIAVMLSASGLADNWAFGAACVVDCTGAGEGVNVDDGAVDDTDVVVVMADNKSASGVVAAVDCRCSETLGGVCEFESVLSTASLDCERPIPFDVAVQVDSAVSAPFPTHTPPSLLFFSSISPPPSASRNNASCSTFSLTSQFCPEGGAARDAAAAASDSGVNNKISDGCDAWSAFSWSVGRSSCLTPFEVDTGRLAATTLPFLLPAGMRTANSCAPGVGGGRNEDEGDGNGEDVCGGGRWCDAPVLGAGEGLGFALMRYDESESLKTPVSTEAITGIAILWLLLAVDSLRARWSREKQEEAR